MLRSMTLRPAGLTCLAIALLAQGLGAQQRKSVREDLAEAQLLGKYSLAEVGKPVDGKVRVVSVEDRGGSWVEFHPSLTSVDLHSPDAKYELHSRNGLWLRNLLSGAESLVDPLGQSGGWAPDARRFVFTSAGKVRIFNLDKGSAEELVAGEYATWSPDGNWIEFERNGGCYLISPTGEGERRLFKVKNWTTPSWSPDGRFVTYTRPGGPSGAFLLWGVKCIEPYRAWIVRAEDGASDWVANTCKPGFTFGWVKNSELAVP